MRPVIICCKKIFPCLVRCDACENLITYFCIERYRQEVWGDYLKRQKKVTSRSTPFINILIHTQNELVIEENRKKNSLSGKIQEDKKAAYVNFSERQ